MRQICWLENKDDNKICKRGKKKIFPEKQREIVAKKMEKTGKDFVIRILFERRCKNVNKNTMTL